VTGAKGIRVLENESFLACPACQSFFQPDLALPDLNMPKMNGHEVSPGDERGFDPERDPSHNLELLA
jgi:hypothetical protein